MEIKLAEIGHPMERYSIEEFLRFLLTFAMKTILFTFYGFIELNEDTAAVMRRHEDTTGTPWGSACEYQTHLYLFSFSAVIC